MAKFHVYEYMAIRKGKSGAVFFKTHFFPILLSKFNTYPWGTTEVTTSISVTQQDMTH